MSRWVRDFRLIPIVLVASVCLLALKVSGLVFDGGYTLSERLQSRYSNDLKVTTENVPPYPKITVADDKPPAPLPAGAAPPPKQSWAQEMFNYGGSPDITGSIDSDENSAPPLKVASKPPAPPTINAGGTTITIDQAVPTSPGERAVLERLQQRRQELDARSRDLDMRESLLKATEKRVEAKVNELKEMETRVKTAMGERDKQEAERFKSLVAMYENMKAKDAARIFDRLDMKILVEVTLQMKPAKMSEVLAQMTPEAAEKLTVELASRSNNGAAKPPTPQLLPKIQGKPN